MTPNLAYRPGASAGTWLPTEDTTRIKNLAAELSGQDVNVRPAYSVEMSGFGRPMWGTGSGFYDPSTGQTVVDPIKGRTHVIAHEIGHSNFPSALAQDVDKKGTFGLSVNPFNRKLAGNWVMHPNLVPRDTGARARYLHESINKPRIVEEAHAQGIANGLLNRLGIKGDDPNPLTYPGEYGIGGKYDGLIWHTQPGGLIDANLPGSWEEWNTQTRSLNPLMQRVYKNAYNKINP